MLRPIGADPGTCVAETLIASASRPSGRGNHAAADHFRGRHHVQQLQAGSSGRDPKGARNRAQRSPRARCGDAADHRRAPGAVADQRPARPGFRGIPPHQPGLPRPVRRRRRRTGGGPRRPPGVLLARTGHGKPATAQQPRHRRQGVRGKEAGLFQPVPRVGQETADRDGRSSRYPGRPGTLRHLLQPADRNFSGHDRAAAAEQGLDDLDLRQRRHQFRARAQPAGDRRQACIALAL